MNELEEKTRTFLKWGRDIIPQPFLYSQRSKREFDEEKMASPGENGNQH
jgi:hypothetical protein